MHVLQCNLKLFYTSFPFSIKTFLYLTDIYTRKRNISPHHIYGINEKCINHWRFNSAYEYINILYIPSSMKHAKHES